MLLIQNLIMNICVIFLQKIAVIKNHIYLFVVVIVAAAAAEFSSFLFLLLSIYFGVFLTVYNK